MLCRKASDSRYREEGMKISVKELVKKSWGLDWRIFKSLFQPKPFNGPMKMELLYA